MTIFSIPEKMLPKIESLMWVRVNRIHIYIYIYFFFFDVKSVSQYQWAVKSAKYHHTTMTA